MKTVCEKDKCAGCMACIDICPKKAISIEDAWVSYNAIINKEVCIECGLCHKVCQSLHPSIAIKPQSWYQGWAKSVDIRKKCSSGGLATEIARSFIADGGIVCGCVFRNGWFGFETAETEEELKKFVGSKYVKSAPIGIYKLIKAKLKNNQKVFFIGLPCQVSSLINFVGTELHKNLYTADLICHGTPSPQILEMFLQQYKYSLEDIKEIQFRRKAKFQLYGDSKSIITAGVSDRYSIAFLNAMTYTENCYSCRYARIERVSDLTLGDSWGSELSEGEQKKGISLVLCQTEKGKELLEKASIHIEDVDIDRAIEKNHQLRNPSIMPKRRKRFFQALKHGRKFNIVVTQYFPKQCFKQDVKNVLIKLKIIGI